MSVFGPAKLHSFEDVLVKQVEDLYDVEERLLKALPKMIEAAGASALKGAFQQHLMETAGHAARLGQVFSRIGRKPKRETSEAMKGLVREGEEIIAADAAPDVKDAALIAAAQRIEHYEISGYGTARSFAQRLGYSDAATLLEETLQEEIAADKKLTEIAETAIQVQKAH